MFRALVFSAAAAGLAGGLAAAAYQGVVVTPLILEAEVFEHGGAAPVAMAAEPARHLMTTLATVVTATGFALVLLALMVLAGIRVERRNAFLWGLAAFAATALAPSVGLPPEVPGMPAGEVLARQIWWVGTAAATGFGLWAIFAADGRLLKAAGVAAIIVPHLLGAPQPESHDSLVPAALAARFVAASLAGSLILWAVTSGVAGAAFARLSKPV